MYGIVLHNCFKHINTTKLTDNCCYYILHTPELSSDSARIELSLSIKLIIHRKFFSRNLHQF